MTEADKKFLEDLERQIGVKEFISKATVDVSIEISNTMIELSPKELLIITRIKRV